MAPLDLGSGVGGNFGSSDEGLGSGEIAGVAVRSDKEVQAEAVDTITTAVAAAIAGAVAAAVASAVAGAVAGLVAGSVGGAAGGAAAGGAGGAGGGGGGGGAGGVTPLVFGAQRMSASSGLAMNQSAMQTGVADGLGWANGKFNLVKSSSRAQRNASTSAGGRLAGKGTGGGGEEEDDDDEDPFMELLDTMVTTGIAAALLVTLRLGLHLYYSRYANAGYYRALRRVTDSSASTDSAPSRRVPRLGVRRVRSVEARLSHRRQRRDANERPPVFKPLPGAFVFPSIEFMFFGIFSLGLTESAVAALCSDTCHSTVIQHWPISVCTATAVAVLAVVAFFTFLSFVVLVNFQCRFSAQLWSKAEATDLKDVEDPLMRLVSRCRLSCRRSTLMDRQTGSFDKSEEDASEPERTERLLASPLTLLHTNAGDAYDALSLFWLSRSSSGGCLKTFFDFAFFLGMLSLGVAYGMEDWAENHGQVVEQGIAVIAIQFGLCFYILCIRPTVDRLGGTLDAIQLAVEGSATFMLVLVFVFPDRAVSLMELSFLLALAAVGIPMILIYYDSILCPLVKAMLTVRSCSSLRTAVVEFVASIPGIALNMMGYDTADLVDTVTSEASQGGGGIVVLPLRERIKAAMVLQRFYRGHVARVEVRRRQGAFAGQTSASQVLSRVRTRIRSCIEAPVRIKKRIRAGSGAIVPSTVVVECVDGVPAEAAPVRTKIRVRSSADSSALSAAAAAAPCEAAPSAAAASTDVHALTRVKTRVRVCSYAENYAVTATETATETATTRTKTRVRMRVADDPAPTVVRTKTRIRIPSEAPPPPAAAPEVSASFVDIFSMPKRLGWF